MLASFDWHLFWQRTLHPDHLLAVALWTTVYIAVAAQVIGVVLGVVAHLMRVSRLLPLRLVAHAYILVFRGTPVIVQIFFIYFGASLFLGFDPFPQVMHFGLFNLKGAVMAGIVGLGLNEGAYMSEIIRAGIDAIDKGQMEAARSLGMRYRLAMRRIVLPQAARVIVPPLGNEFNNMLKSTSLVAFIGVYELFQDAQIRYSTLFKPSEIFLAAAMWYLLLTTVWTVIQAQIEHRLAVSERGHDELTFGQRMMRAWAPVAVWARGR